MTTPTDPAPTRPKLAVWKFASLRRLPAHPAQLRGRAAPAGRRGRDRLLPGGDPGGRRGPVRPLAGRGLGDHARGRSSGSSRSAAMSRRLVTIGACATSGGIQALRNFADVAEFRSIVYAHPEYIATLATLDPDLRARPRRLRAARLPDRQAPAARGPRRRRCRAASRGSPPTASAWSASAAATSASRSPTARRASDRSPTPAAARSARPTTAAATAASARRTPRTPPSLRGPAARRSA